jgi:hypothetical protein
MQKVVDIHFVDIETFDQTYLSTSFMPSGHDLPHWLSNGISYETLTEPNFPKILLPEQQST